MIRRWYRGLSQRTVENVGIAGGILLFAAGVVLMVIGASRLA